MFQILATKLYEMAEYNFWFSWCQLAPWTNKFILGAVIYTYMLLVSVQDTVTRADHNSD